MKPRSFELWALARHPAAFLLLVNVISALLAIAQFSFTLTVLRPLDFAVAGVIAAISGVVTQLFDARAVDVTTRLYAARPADAHALRSDDLAAGLALQASLALAITLVIVPSAMLIAPLFLDQPVSWWWVVCMAVAAGTRSVFVAIGAYLRLIGNFRASGWLNLAFAVVALVVTVALLTASPNLDGYFAAIGLFNVLLLAAALVIADGMVRRALGCGLLRMPPTRAFLELVESRHFLMANSLTSFSRVIARCDILVIAALGGDAIAGIYRVARLAYDALLGLGDALHQFYNPTLIAAVIAGDTNTFRALKTQLAVIGGVAGIWAVAGSLLVLGPISAAYFPLHQAAIVPIAVFAGLITINIGIHGWLWPVLVARGSVGTFSLLSLAGAVVQLLALLALGMTGWLSPVSAAATNWLPALMTYVPYLARGRDR